MKHGIDMQTSILLASLHTCRYWCRTCILSVVVGHRALHSTFFTTSGSKLTIISRIILSHAGPLDNICMNT